MTGTHWPGPLSIAPRAALAPKILVRHQSRWPLNLCLAEVFATMFKLNHKGYHLYVLPISIIIPENTEWLLYRRTPCLTHPTLSTHHPAWHTQPSAHWTLPNTPNPLCPPPYPTFSGSHKYIRWTEESLTINVSKTKEIIVGGCR